jgi:hypothetical protein
MYIWRNLPEGQLLAVLRWLQARRSPASAEPAKPETAAPLDPMACPRR